MTPTDLRTFRRRLLSWFRKNARALPWRATRDAYAIWISEIMLQQTQVATVIPYFQRFLERFPTLVALADAGEQEVLCLWAGLGYYRRARDLWRAARQLHEAGHGTVPNDPDLVRTLSGFGRYTANAVLSQAYDRPLPIVEANSLRVLCRLFAIDQDPKQNVVQKQLWRLAETLVPRTRAGDFNQAMMELGALVCTPHKPDCGQCPVAAHCQARRTGRQDEIPPRAKSPEIVAIEEVAAIVRKFDKLLLAQRPDGGRWARMWEFPHHAVNPGEAHADSVVRLLETVGLEGEVQEELATIDHSLTRFRITMTCYAVAHKRRAGALKRYTDAVWIAPTKLTTYPLSAPQKRLVAFLQEQLLWTKAQG